MSTTIAGSPVRTAEQRRQRRVMAGQCGGEFELVRDGDSYTYRYASPDRRRNEPNGEFSWERNPSSRDQGDFHAIDIRHNEEKISLMRSAGSQSYTNQQDWSIDGLEDRLAKQVEQNRKYGCQHRNEYEESVYSRHSGGEEAQTTSISRVGISVTPADAANDAGSMIPHSEQVWWTDSGHVTGIDSGVEVTKNESRSPSKKKSFASIQSVKRFKKIVQKGNGVNVVRKVNRFFSTVLRSQKSTHEEGKDHLVDAQSGLLSGLQVEPNTSNALKSCTRYKSESPVKEQINLEKDDEVHEDLNREFFAPVASGSRSIEKVEKKSSDSEVFD